MVRRRDRGLLLLSALLMIVGCAPKPPAPPVAPQATLDGNKLGNDFLAADEANRLLFCTSAVKAYRTSGVQSFAVSPSIGNLTPAAFCQQLADYFTDEPYHRSERLSQAAATAMLLYAKPKPRQADSELDSMRKSPANP